MASVPIRARPATQGMDESGRRVFPGYAAGRMQNATSGQKQQALEKRMIESMDQGRARASAANRRILLAAKRMDSPMPVKISPMFSIEE